MAFTGAEADLQRAKEFRKQAQSAKDARAKQDFYNAADRLERRAAKKARKVARGRKPGQLRDKPTMLR